MDISDELSDELSAFHINDEPTKHKFKEYGVNQEFHDSRFYTHNEEVDHTSSGSSFGSDGIMDYGTVQQRTKSSRGTTVEDKPPQYMEYLKNRNPKYREPESELIVKNIGNLSGNVCNTFKRKGERTTDDEEEEEEEENGSDPALEANAIYNNFLKQHKNHTNFREQSPTPIHYETGENKINLITPGSIGYEFKNSAGEWFPKNEFQDISTSHMVDNTNTTTTNQSNSHIQSTKLDETEALDETQEIDATMPIDTPQLEEKYRAVSSKQEVGRKDEEFTGDVTALSDIDVSTYNTNEQNLVSVLYDLLEVNSDGDWSKITSIDLSKQEMENISGIEKYLPGLRELKLCHNRLQSLSIMESIKLRSLDASNNMLCQIVNLHDYNNIEVLNLSHNKIKGNLNFIKSCHRLRDLDLSFNEIDFIELGDSNLINVNLSHNKIRGTLDLIGKTSLQEINLSNNNIKSIINIPTTLRVLNVNNNNYSITLQINKQMPFLTTLHNNNHNSNQALQQSMPLHYLQNLKILTTSSTTCLDTLPQNLTSLTILGTGENDNNKIPWDSLPPTLQSLTIKNCNLKSLPCNSDMYGIPRDMQFNALKKLNLSNNSLTSCHNLIEFLPFKSLQEIDIRGNPFVNARDTETREAINHALRLAAPALHTIKF